MTGPSWALIAIPIVVVIVLTVWLVLVYYADSHPAWKGQSAPPRRPRPEAAGPPELRPHVPGQRPAPEAGPRAPAGAGPEQATGVGPDSEGSPVAPPPVTHR